MRARIQMESSGRRMDCTVCRASRASIFDGLLNGGNKPRLRVSSVQCLGWCRIDSLFQVVRPSRMIAGMFTMLNFGPFAYLCRRYGYNCPTMTHDRTHAAELNVRTSWRLAQFKSPTLTTTFSQHLCTSTRGEAPGQPHATANGHLNAPH